MIFLENRFLSGCDRYLATPTGDIMSPNYPDNYPHRANCKYTIAIASGLQIALVFQDFAIENHASCRYDNLKIFDGANNTSPLLGTFCGTLSPGRIVSTGNMLHLEFQSDFSSSAKGFFANYTTGSARKCCLIMFLLIKHMHINNCEGITASYLLHNNDYCKVSLKVFGKL